MNAYSRNAALFRKRLISSNIATNQNIEGIPANFYKVLEKRYRLKLPDSYREFLENFGASAGSLKEDIDLYFHEIQDDTELVRSDLEGDELQLPDNAFVFCSRHGEQFLFFKCDGSNDPPIYYYADWVKRFELRYDSLWCFLNELLQQATPKTDNRKYK